MNKLLQKFLPKRLRTLGDVDNMPLSEADKIGILEQFSLPNIDRVFIEQYGLVCRKCNGELEKVLPEITMNSMTLYECERCQERRYI